MTTTPRYEVRRTVFHVRNGVEGKHPSDASDDVISWHRTEAAAERAARRVRRGDCMCGCAVVVKVRQ